MKKLLKNKHIICPICGNKSKIYYKFNTASYFKCDFCTSIFQHPLPNINDLNKYADNEYSDGLYNQYVQAAKLKKATFEERVKNIIKVINKKRHLDKQKLLDLGCSCGYFIEAALEKKINSYGVEFSKVAINLAPKKIRSRIIHGDVNKLDKILKSKYNIITAFDILEHTLDPLVFVTNAKQYLKEGGLLVISTPDTGHYLRPLMGKKWPMLQPHQHTFLFSRHGLQILLKKAGYKSIKFTPAKKQITLNYIMGQIRIFLPGLYNFYTKISPIIPNAIKDKSISVNISELMVFAKS